MSSFPRFPFCTHLFTAVVLLALLLPLPMLLSHWLLAASVWIHSSPVPQTNGHTCSGEGQIFCPVTLSTGQTPECQSALMAANPRATRYSKTLWEYPLINLRDEEIGCPNGLVRVGQDGGGGGLGGENDLLQVILRIYSMHQSTFVGSSRNICIAHMNSKGHLHYVDVEHLFKCKN